MSAFDQNHYALADRRRSARDAYYGRYSLGDHIGGSARKEAVRECIETATRVRIDGQLMAHVFPLIEGKLGLRDAEQVVAAAFRAAGFEVEDDKPPLAVRKHESLCNDNVCFEDDFTEKCTCWCHETGER